MALWMIAAGGVLLVPDPKPAKAGALALDDVRALLAARSPGMREDGALFQTKLAFLDRYDPGHHERVLGGDRYHPGGGAAGGGGDPVGGVPGGGGVLPTPGGAGNGFGGDDDPGGAPASFAGGGGGALTAIGGLLTGGGSGGGSAGGGAATPSPPALPEPATWLCMIVGLFAVGSVARRRPMLGMQALR